MDKGQVALVGAGCGSMDLITLRGLRLLRQCEVVVYDDLIDEALLNEAPSSAERIYMGKRLGRRSAMQEDITAVLVEKAMQGKRVVRLKGGDPFVFGRGGEEALALEQAGISCEEVPGISSPIAIPAASGIPVTHHEISRSFHVITGHTAERADGLPEDLEQLAALHGTLVFLMGLSRLEEIAQGLIRFGKLPETPAAVISGGNADHPITVRGTLTDIASRVRQAGVRAPAIIVVGGVAALKLSTASARPLDRVRVGITGTDDIAGKLKIALEEQGAQVIRAARSVVKPLPLTVDIKTLLDGSPRWLVFTSANGVRLFFRQLWESGLDLRRLAACKFAVIGSETGASLERYGIHADLCPQIFTSGELAKALCRTVLPGEDVVLLRSTAGAPILPLLLREHEIPVQEYALYDLRTDREAAERAVGLVEGLDYLTFSSAGGVNCFFDEGGRVADKTTCVCIGEITAATLRQRYEKPFLTSESITAGGIVSTILHHHASH